MFGESKKAFLFRRERKDENPRILMTHSALWWRQAGKRVKEATMVPGIRRVGRIREDERRKMSKRERALIMFR